MLDDKYAEIKERISVLIDLFFEEDTTSQQRKQIIEEVEKFPEHLTGALFNIIGHNYDFEINGNPYTLQYYSKYYLNTFTSEYVINLYNGQVDENNLIKQECDKFKSKMYTKFLKLVDSIKDGNFDLENYLQ